MDPAPSADRATARRWGPSILLPVWIVERLVDQSRIRNLERRLADAEARLIPRRPSDALH
jgi:hypothetical protein